MKWRKFSTNFSSNIVDDLDTSKYRNEFKGWRSLNSFEYDLGFNPLYFEYFGNHKFDPQSYKQIQYSSPENYMQEQFNILKKDINDRRIEDPFLSTLLFLSKIQDYPENSKLDDYYVKYYDIQPMIIEGDGFGFNMVGYTYNPKYNFVLICAVFLDSPEYYEAIENFEDRNMYEIVNINAANIVSNHLSKYIHKVLPEAYISDLYVDKMPKYPY